jgi:hypothetical protein
MKQQKPKRKDWKNSLKMPKKTYKILSEIMSMKFEKMVLRVFLRT